MWIFIYTVETCEIFCQVDDVGCSQGVRSGPHTTRTYDMINYILSFKIYIVNLSNKSLLRTKKHF